MEVLQGGAGPTIIFSSVAIIHCHWESFSCVVTKGDVCITGEGSLRVSGGRRLFHILYLKPVSVCVVCCVCVCVWCKCVWCVCVCVCGVSACGVVCMCGMCVVVCVVCMLLVEQNEYKVNI